MVRQPAALTTALVAAVAVILACGIAGGYGTLGAGVQNGLFDAIHNAVTGHEGAVPPYLPGGPLPYCTTFTGVPVIDRPLLGTVAWFILMIDAPQTWDVRLSFWYLMAQFCAAWCLISLEGQRRINRGRLVSW